MSMSKVKQIGYTQVKERMVLMALNCESMCGAVFDPGEPFIVKSVEYPFVIVEKRRFGVMPGESPTDERTIDIRKVSFGRPSLGFAKKCCRTFHNGEKAWKALSKNNTIRDEKGRFVKTIY